MARNPPMAWPWPCWLRRATVGGQRPSWMIYARWP